MRSFLLPFALFILAPLLPWSVSYPDEFGAKGSIAGQFNPAQPLRTHGALAPVSPLADAGAPASSSNSQSSATPASKEPASKELMTNTLGMELRLLPAGEFLMGGGESAAELEQAFGRQPWLTEEWIAAEKPHRVRVSKPLYFGAYEVTRGQFEKFVEAAQYQTDAEIDGKGGWGWRELENRFSQDLKFTWRDWGAKQGPAYPVVNVSWHDAKAFCDWLSKKEGKRYRLPTEAEWEYACRAGTTTRFYNGNDVVDLVKIGNVKDRAARLQFRWWKDYVNANDAYVFPAPVGCFQPNAFALYDLAGNVAEWCSDWYEADYYRRSPAKDPQGPADGDVRVIRGGGWNFHPIDSRSASRRFDFPEYRHLNLGFRVVCEK